MANNLVIEFSSPDLTQALDVSSMGITNINELWFMYTTDGYNWITIDPSNLSAGVTIVYTPTTINKANPIMAVQLNGLPTGITKLIAYRLTDLNELPQFTSGNIHTAAIMNKMRDVILKALEETRGDTGSIQNILASLLQAKEAAETARDDAQAAQSATETARDTTLEYQNTTKVYMDTTKTYRDTTKNYMNTAGSSEVAAVANADTVAAYLNSVQTLYNFIINNKLNSPLRGIDGGSASSFASSESNGDFVLDGGYAIPQEQWGFYSWIDPGDANGNAPEDDAVIDDVDGGAALATQFTDYYDGGGASAVYFRRPSV